MTVLYVYGAIDLLVQYSTIQYIRFRCSQRCTGSGAETGTDLELVLDITVAVPVLVQIRMDGIPVTECRIVLELNGIESKKITTDRKLRCC